MKSSRLPRVRRFEYLTAFLSAIGEGLGYKEIGDKLAEKKREFEIEKHKALGRGRPFGKALAQSKSLIGECRNLAIITGMIERGQALRLSPIGSNLTLSKDPDGTAKLLGETLLASCQLFAKTLVLLSDLPQSEILAPLERNEKLYSEYVSNYELGISQLNLEIVRDWSTQLGFINWHVEDERGKRFMRVYLCSTVQKSTSTKGWIGFMYTGIRYAITPNSIEQSVFKNLLWEEYLRKARFVPKKPVFYSQIRAGVCYKARISDRLFDQEVNKLIRHDDKYLVVGSGGSLPKVSDPAGMLKYLPPKTDRGDYIVYLRMDER